MWPSLSFQCTTEFILAFAVPFPALTPEPKEAPGWLKYVGKTNTLLSAPQPKVS